MTTVNERAPHVPLVALGQEHLFPFEKPIFSGLPILAQDGHDANETSLVTSHWFLTSDFALGSKTESMQRYGFCEDKRP
jgi:hypothetical protein